MRERWKTAVVSAALYLALSPLTIKADGAEGTAPFLVRNHNPIVAVFAIPGARGTATATEGETLLDVGIEQTSHFTETNNAAEQILFDGETTRLSLTARYGLSDSWQLGLDLPFVRHSGGFLDGLIINWHDLWGLPQSGRDVFERNQIDFRYSRGGRTAFDIDSDISGIGDIVVFASRKLRSENRSRVVLHTQLKLPSGDAGKLTGSESVDLGASLAAAQQWSDKLHSNFYMGAAYLGEGNVLNEFQKDWAVSAGADLSFRATRSLFLKAQYDAHTSPYSGSSLDQIDLWSGMLTLGATVKFGNKALDFAVVEDVPNGGVVPDVTFYLYFRTSLGSSNKS